MRAYERCAVPHCTMFVCVAAIVLNELQQTRTSECRLCLRQTSSGGLQGRPEKLQDVCYSWWAVSALSLLGRQHWIDRDALAKFILNSQDEHRGGISDRPDDMVDVFHTFFGIAALSLLGFPGLRPVSPTYALPQDVIDDLGISNIGKPT